MIWFVILASVISALWLIYFIGIVFWVTHYDFGLSRITRFGWVMTALAVLILIFAVLT